MNPFEKVFYWLVAGSKGGSNRARILLRLIKNPMNSNRLSEALKLDYKTVQHHLEIMEETGVIVRTGKKYGHIYTPSAEFEANQKGLMAWLKNSAAKKQG